MHKVVNATPFDEAQRVRDFFETNVEEWDTLRYQDETYIGRARVALRWLRRLRAKTVLDIGCGTGHQTVALLKHGHRVVAVDFSEAMARRTRTRIRRELSANTAMVVVADAMHPPFRDLSFDAILALGLVGFCEDRSALLSAFNRMLPLDGALICDAGLPEEEVLFQVFSARLRRWRDALFRRSPRPRGRGWYSANFIKHSPAAFEGLLKGAGFMPRGRGGAGFGDLNLDGLPLIPWRVQVRLARLFSRLSTLRGCGFIARHALTYVVWSAKHRPHLPGQ